MKKQYLVLLLSLGFGISTTIPSFAQSEPKFKTDSDYPPEMMDGSYLSGIAEAILVNNEPTIRINNHKGQSIEIRLQNRDGEQAIVLPVTKMVLEGGKLFITKTKLVYLPNKTSKDDTVIDRGQIKSVKLHSRWRLGMIANISIDYEGGNRTLVGMPTDGDRETTEAVNAFISRAIIDFDGALTEFKRLTASVQPESDEQEETDADVDATVGSKYDRFRDITIVQTPKLLVKGTKKSLRAHVELYYEGKTLAKLNRISLILDASSARPLFREDDLALNMLVDENRLPLGSMKITSEDRTKSLIKQTLSIDLSRETLERIATGKDVEFQIGNLEYKIPDTQLQLFKKALDYKLEKE